MDPRDNKVRTKLGKCGGLRGIDRVGVTFKLIVRDMPTLEVTFSLSNPTGYDLFFVAGMLQ